MVEKYTLLYHMRIKHKYLRNKHFWNKHWKRIRAKEQPFKTLFPYSAYTGRLYPTEEQIRQNFEWITQQARALETGQACFMNSPAFFRRLLNRKRKSRERSALSKIRQGDYEAELPTFRKDANALYW